ncbi:MAG TPA: hypothetical protein VFQ44_01930 [Streptosporangiaceae bacterium]|nr:hypothetical protein [Streptosporangiaceae bacterium]
MNIAEHARTAYAQGWALSGGPLTPRVQAGCAAATDHATAHADDPRILEATLQIGKLEGTWATFFQRREHAITTGTDAVKKAWDTLTRDIRPGSTVKTLRAEAGLTLETVSYTATITGAAASGLLAGIYAHDKHSHLKGTVETALRAGWAEGRAGLLAINAEKHGYTVTETAAYNWPAAYQSIYGQLENLPDLPLMADAWIQRMLNGAARDIGTLLARLLETGASRTDMVDAVEEALSAAGSESASARAVTLFMDQAIAQAMSSAAVALYASEGIDDVYFVTAGDERVCPLCEAAEAASPYTPDTAPLPGLHPRCMPGDVLVSATSAVNAGYARWYEGDLAVIYTASGNELAVTPNHPIATPEGWIAAGSLEIGQSVLSDRNWAQRVSGESPGDQQIPAPIGEVVHSLRHSSSVPSVRVPATAEQFHGDGIGGDVEVVLADRFLQGDRDAHRVGDRSLTSRGPGLSQFDADRAPLQLLGTLPDTARSIVGSGCEPGPFGGVGLSHSREHSLTAVPRLDTGLDEAATDDTTVDAERHAQSLLALPLQIPAHDLSIVDGDALGHDPLTAPTSLDARTAKPRADGVHADADGFCDHLATFTGDIAPDEIVNIERQRFRGHVYNLDTGQGWYFANAIVSHNCRCVLTSDDPAPYKALAALLIS